MDQIMGTIFDFKRFSINDGPGTRTTVFLKGCSLSCLWCHNPESQAAKSQLVYYKDKCIGCHFCIKVCPVKAIIADELSIVVDMNKCIVCGNCAKVCPSEALEVIGTSYSISQVMDIIMKDTIFYDDSGGGVTFSGGEPLRQKDFLLELLKNCREEDIHTAVDTTGFVMLTELQQIMDYTDLFLYDIKHMDSKKHKEITGVGNSKILDNLKYISDTGANISIRIPVIPGINTGDNLIKTADFIKNLDGIVSVDLLPYHNIMKGKYDRLGMDYALGNINCPNKDYMTEIKNIFEDRNLNVTIGGE